MKVRAIRRGHYLRARDIGEVFDCPREHVCLERDHGLAGWMVLVFPTIDAASVPEPAWRKALPNLRMPH